MLNNFPTHNMFQRLNSFPLDNTNIFNTLQEAEDYAVNNSIAYEGQLIYIKNETEHIYYIDTDFQLKPICLFSDEAIKLLLDYIYIEFKNGDSSAAIEEFKKISWNTYEYVRTVKR